MRIRLKTAASAAAAVGLAVVLGAAAAAMVVYANADSLDVVEKKSPAGKTIVTVQRNAPLNVIAKEGKWYKVDVQGKQGYVFYSAVADKPGQATGKGVNFGAIQGGSIPGLDTAAAAKGLEPGTQQYASSSGLSTAGLQELGRRRAAITAAECDGFVAAGGLKVADANSASPMSSALAVAK